jgi:NAD(P)-dependent dehydrogenase (short-subunit alcohol dehydrogenase family)
MANTRRVAFVTGGAQGLGAEMARRFVSDGLAVVVADINGAGAAELAHELGDGRVAVGIHLDVTSDESVGRAVDEARSAFGRIDVLVNNAGILSRRPAEDTVTDDWIRELEVNLGGTMRCSRAAFESLRRGEFPCVINMGSVASSLGLPLRLAYSTAKSGIAGLTRTLAAEWGRHGIRVNAIAPGYIDTSLMRSGFELGVLDETQILRRTPLGRLGEPREIASVASFLASPDASFVTGVMLRADGGVTIDGDFRPVSPGAET